MTVFTRHWIAEDTKQPDRGLLQGRGPALQISISVPDARAALLTEAQQAIPAPQVGTALIDTGAAFTAIDSNHLEALGLTPIRTIKVIGPTGEDEQGVYQCKLEFLGTGIQAFEHTVIGSKISGFNHASLIGRDILQYFLLIYNGVDGHWSLAV